MNDPDEQQVDVQPAVSVIIVSYNTRAMTLDCLAALYADLDNSRVEAEVLVVDNASADGSANAIRAAFSRAKVIEMGRNAGFGAANNAAMAQARGEFLLLLNSDAFLKPGATAAMIECMRRYRRAGVVGPRLLNVDGSLQRSCFRYPTPWQAWSENLWLARLFAPTSRFGDYRRWAHNEEIGVDWIVGACLMVRNAVYKKVGGFDEQFFMYAEETDWQKRIRSQESDIVFTPSAVVTHLGGASGGSQRTKINRYFFDSLDLYSYKHHGVPGLLAVHAAMVVGCFVRLCLWAPVWALGRTVRREHAAAKIRLMAWLCVRQLTTWSVKSTGA